jgi:hypothetical protein
MRTATDHGFPVTVHVHRGRMPAAVRTVDRVLLGLGPTLLRPGLLPENRPAADPHEASCPPHR